MVFTLNLVACLVVPALLMVGATAGATGIPAGDRRLHLFETHTGEHIDIVYRRGSAYDPVALSRLDQFLRDHRTGEVHHYDPRVFDLLSDLTASAGLPDAEIDVICGYRSAWSNEYLRTHTAGVARNSLHMQAEAIDIRLPGLSTTELRRKALLLSRGGVGYYPASDFVHIDVGRIRLVLAREITSGRITLYLRDKEGEPLWPGASTIDR